MATEFFKRYKHKVKLVEELTSIISSYPRNEKVIMCHGVFDVVHPGHIRHFAYAKSKSDILVVSVTADKHIKKGNIKTVKKEFAKMKKYVEFIQKTVDSLE